MDKDVRLTALASLTHNPDLPESMWFREVADLWTWTLFPSRLDKELAAHIQQERASGSKLAAGMAKLRAVNALASAGRGGRGSRRPSTKSSDDAAPA